MQPFYMLTAVDARKADSPGTTRATTIAKLTIPAIKFFTASHNPGGGVMAVDFTLPRIEAPEPAFAVKGVDTEIFKDFGQRSRWTFAGSYRDKQTGKVVPARAIIEGAIVEWSPDEASPEEFSGCNHIFKEVTHYEFSLAGEELWYSDFFERVLRSGGKDIFAAERKALGI